MKDLAKEFSIPGNVKCKKIYDDIWEIEKKSHKDPDIESIMSIIVSLKDKEHIKENLDDFALFILNKNSIDIQDSIKYNTEDLNELEDLYKEFIRSKIKPNPKEIELAFKIYDKFFIMLYNHFYPSIQEQPEKQTQFYKELEKGSRCMHYDFNIFTTNYDTLIEKYFIDNLKDEVYTGSEGPKKYFNMGDFNSRYSQSNSTQVKLIKLHGSKNWLKDNEGNLIEKGLDEDIISVSSGRISGAITGEVMIYPPSQKQLYLSPFIQFFNYLERELCENKIWIVIGYSFRDIVIRTMFEKSANTIKNIILVAPNAQSIKNLFNNELQDKIIEIQGDFGNQEVNETISENLKKIEKKILQS
jgi:hypothetical protein